MNMTELSTIWDSDEEEQINEFDTYNYNSCIYCKSDINQLKEIIGIAISNKKQLGFRNSMYWDSTGCIIQKNEKVLNFLNKNPEAIFESIHYTDKNEETRMAYQTCCICNTSLEHSLANSLYICKKCEPDILVSIEFTVVIIWNTLRKIWLCNSNNSCKLYSTAFGQFRIFPRILKKYGIDINIFIDDNIIVPLSAMYAIHWDISLNNALKRPDIPSSLLVAIQLAKLRIFKMDESWLNIKN